MEFEMRNILDFCSAEYLFLSILNESKLRGGIIETGTQAGLHIIAPCWSRSHFKIVIFLNDGSGVMAWTPWSCTACCAPAPTDAPRIHPLCARWACWFSIATLWSCFPPTRWSMSLVEHPPERPLNVTPPPRPPVVTTRITHNLCMCLCHSAGEIHLSCVLSCVFN